MDSIKSKLLRKWLKLVNQRHEQKIHKKVTSDQTSEPNSIYTTSPKVSLIVQFFNKKPNIKSIITALRLTSAEELIVIDDGSSDGSYEEWMKYLDRKNDFLLRCNDLFEVRTYERAIGMAKGEFVCLLQDDDIPPYNNTWIEQALSLFEALPRLLILGGRGGLDFFTPDPVEPNEESTYKKIGDIITRPGLFKKRIYDTPQYIEPQSGIPFIFVTSVNRAPTLLRRKPFLELGGINQEYAPFQFDDDEASVRAWLAGYQVGLYPCPFIRNVATGGMRIFNSERVDKQSVINAKKFYEAYGSIIASGELQKMIDSANQKLINFPTKTK
jgi:glycosyltransferase involved in cell wall biosynthesis